MDRNERNGQASKEDFVVKIVHAAHYETIFFHEALVALVM